MEALGGVEAEEDKVAGNLAQKLTLPMMQTVWSAQLNPLLKNPTNSISIIKDYPLLIGANVINHLLQRQMQGWFLTDIQGTAQIYRSAPFNDLTLTLTSDSLVTVSIGVF